MGLLLQGLLHQSKMQRASQTHVLRSDFPQASLSVVASRYLELSMDSWSAQLGAVVVVIFIRWANADKLCDRLSGHKTYN